MSTAHSAVAFATRLVTGARPVVVGQEVALQLSGILIRRELRQEPRKILCLQNIMILNKLRICSDIIRAKLLR